MDQQEKILDHENTDMKLKVRRINIILLLLSIIILGFGIFICKIVGFGGVFGVGFSLMVIGLILIIISLIVKNPNLSQVLGIFGFVFVLGSGILLLTTAWGTPIGAF